VTLPSGRVIEAWTFGSLPGPTLTARVGETLEVTLRNRDIAAGVTLHWHGLSVPNGEDGVAGVTQDAVPPGGTFVYRFRVEQPGTYWYHTHQHGREGITRGLYGALVVQPAAGPVTGVDLVLPFHTQSRTSMLADSDQMRREVVAAGTPVRLRLVNTDQQPRRFALSGTPFRVVALDGVDLNGPTEVSGQALRVPAGGRYDLAFAMPAGPVRLSVEGARQAGLLLAATGDDPDPGGEVPKATFDPTTYGTSRPVPEMAGGYDVSATMVLDRLPRLVNGRPALAQTVNGGVYPDIPPIMVAEGDLVRMRVVNRSFETHPMHPHGHHVLVLSVNGRVPSGSPLWLDTFDVQPGEIWEVALRADNPGIWMDHCHNLEHATQGMMFHLAYAGVHTPFTHGPGSPNRPE
jgi:FtsP/CotA-like multicopper oxidase with cupredoxin domain